MRRIAVLATLVSLTLLTLPAAGQAAFVTGIGDQRTSMFTSPFYAPLKVKDVRYIVPWDGMEFPAQIAENDAWFAAATAANSRILVAFNVSRQNSRKEVAPSKAAYGKAVAKFIKRYGSRVKAYQPWNEVNACPSQPDKLCKGTGGAKRAADYFLELKKRAPGKTIVALDVLDTDFKGASKFAKNFAKFAKKGKPKIWGLHNYSDTNRNSSTRTKYILKNGFPKGSQVWLTETGGVAQFGSFEYDLARQAKSFKQMFKIARQNKTIKKVYLYNWTGQTNSDSPKANGKGRPFDAGIVGPDGLPRPAYTVVKNRG
jgi:hypothetical protein